MRKPDPSVFDQPDDDARAIAEGEADLAAGRVVPHKEVAEWLKTSGTPASKPPPKSWFK